MSRTSAQAKPPPDPTVIRQLGLAPYASFAMIAGMQLDLFSPLAKGSLSVDDLADTLGLNADKLRLLLDALVEAGLLELDNNGFANTEEAQHYLVKGKPSYLGGSHGFYTARFRECFHTAESLRRGAPQAKLDFTGMTGAELEHYYRGMHPGSLSGGRSLAARFDLSAHRHLLDIGGGSGGTAIALAEQHPALRLTVLDLLSVTPFSARYVEEAGLSERIAVVAHDITSGPQPGTYDGVIIKSFIQVLSREDARRALEHVYSALEPGSPVYLQGHVLDDSRLSPPGVVSFNLVFLNVYDEGQAYTEREYRAWLERAGFTGVERTVVAGGSSYLTASKPA